LDDRGFDAKFDVVVVGGGSAGCVVAARLSEIRSVSVCLVEAGVRDRSPRIHAPFGFPWLAADEGVNWGYETAAEPELNGRQIRWPRGKVLGGSGSINGLVFLRGLPSDFDEWRRRGAFGWGYEDVLPYFKRCEHNISGADAWRGQHGPITVSSIKQPSQPARAFVEACERLQYPRVIDFNGASCDGVGYTQLNVRHGWRSSTSVGYLRPAARRRNLELITEAVVRRILLDGRKAVGVELERAGRVVRIGARAEIVVCGGAINSPLLLLASGIGDATELGALGATVAHDLPGVGKGLQDHFLIPLKFRTSAPGTLNEIVRSPLLAAKAAVNWLTSGSGQFAVGGTEVALFARSRAAELLPDIQFQCANFSNDTFESGLHPWPGFMSCFYACRPASRGDVSLRDPAGRLPPRIRANYLTNAEDRRITLSGYQIANQLMVTEPMKSLILQRISPTDNCVTEALMTAHMCREGTTGNHPCGTARMGVDDKAVVDPALKVRGLSNLRIIDASVMPSIPSSNIHAATIMIAEKGSDLVSKSLRGLGG
jgi:choline dehydrogenase